ncbi:MAG: hypothetical protein K6E38_07950 [Fretibacterium sp.]|nr:hypothetical protein [Fretibacterium sp.]
MQVTSMLSAGYLEPSVQLTGRQQKVQQTEKEADSLRAPVAGSPSISEQGEAAALSRREADVLAQEQSLRAKTGYNAEVSTVYSYTMGPDGRRYITGASMTMKGDAEDLNRVGGGITTREFQAEEQRASQEKVSPTEDKSGSRSPDSADKGKNSAGSSDLSEEQEAQVREMTRTEREVIAHEAAHQAAAGAFGGGVSYSYTQGPDGKSYITGGEVPIQLKSGSTPEETLRNMQQVQRAALAPADPSGQDRRVAAKAAAMATQAQQEIAAKRGSSDENREGVTEVARGTPVADAKKPQEEDPAKNGVASIVASIKEAQVQAQLLSVAA